MSLIRTLVAECDHPPCLSVFEFHVDSAEAYRPFITLLNHRLATENILPSADLPGGTILTYCPDHDTQEKRDADR